MKIKKWGIGVLTASLLLLIAGCGEQGHKPGAQPPVAVNAYKVVATDTELEQTYPGSIVPSQTVIVRSRVAGHVVEKYVRGGEYVTQGQALFKLDSRQYEASLATAQANMAQSNANYQQARADLQRYELLAQEEAIASQVLEAQRSKVAQSKAAYDALAAQTRLAAENVHDVVIYAPFSGTLGVDTVEVGTFVAAGSTPLVTLSANDSVLVEFSLSESEYISLVKKDKSVHSQAQLTLALGDGSIYEYPGKIVQVSQSLESGSGKLLLKAEFPNPDNLLLPGMYASIVKKSEPMKDTLLVPSKALLQILDKNFLLLLGEDNTVKQIPVTVGATVGKYVVITNGIKDGDVIVVDGLTKAHAGSVVQPSYVTKEELDKS